MPPKRLALITGATNGIGLAAACELARRGIGVAITARDAKRGADAALLIGRAAGSGSVPVFEVDLASQDSIRACAGAFCATFDRLDLLVNNAGAIFRTFELTEDGIERTWAVNHLAPFLLTGLLLPLLGNGSRVITTASGAHRGRSIPFSGPNDPGSFGPWRRYGETKLANILFTRELDRHLGARGAVATCFHPGVVRTGFNHNNGPLRSVGMRIVAPFFRSPERGARTLVFLAEDEQGLTGHGGYFFDNRPGHLSKRAKDDRAARQLWEMSERASAISY